MRFMMIVKASKDSEADKMRSVAGAGFHSNAILEAK